MKFFYIHRSVTNPMVCLREAYFRKLMSTDTEAHSQTLDQARGTFTEVEERL